MSFRMFRPLAVCAALCVAGHLALAQSKVAVINVQKALTDTAEIKAANAQMQAAFAPRQAQLDKLQQELATLSQKLQTDSTLSQQAQMDLQAEGKRKQTEAQRIQEDLQADATEMRNSILAKSSDRMQAVIKKLAEEKAVDLIVDTQVALYFKPTLDLTADATAAYDKTYPAAAATAPAPPKK